MKYGADWDPNFAYDMMAMQIRTIETVDFVPTDTEDIRIIYVILCQSTGRVKIGMTEDLDKRFAEIQAMCPTKLTLLYVFHSVGAQMETYFHRMFKSQRLHYEWFQWSPAMETFFDSLQLQVAAAISKWLPKDESKTDVAGPVIAPLPDPGVETVSEPEEPDAKPVPELQRVIDSSYQPEPEQWEEAIDSPHGTCDLAALK